jgi:DHA2 family multidrug resistance protein
VLRNRNFAVGTLLMTVVGVVLYSTTALLPLFLQTLMNYPALNSGMAISPRGIGAIAALMVVGRLVGKVDTRLLMGFGFSLLAYSSWQLGDINLQISIGSIVWPIVLSGVAIGFIFVPLATTTMGDLPNEQMGNAAGIFNLMRNIGGSIGISITATMVARGAQVHQALLVHHLTPYDPQYQQQLRIIAGVLARFGDPVTAYHRAQALLGGTVMQNAALCAYVDTFRILTVLCALCVPLVLVFRRVRPHDGPAAVH